ncbi:nuclear transport factor 2 family protein [Streptomyces hygroscopicus]|uniref:nuclear transport factor 2 family protein n=1 Tax=Streptomyces hygroscopicus TaxID=1912 RepID=UPI0036A06BB5
MWHGGWRWSRPHCDTPRWTRARLPPGRGGRGGSVPASGVAHGAGAVTRRPVAPPDPGGVRHGRCGGARPGHYRCRRRRSPGPLPVPSSARSAARPDVHTPQSRSHRGAHHRWWPSEGARPRLPWSAPLGPQGQDQQPSCPGPAPLVPAQPLHVKDDRDHGRHRRHRRHRSVQGAGVLPVSRRRRRLGAARALFAETAVYRRPGYEPMRGQADLMAFYTGERVIAEGKHTVVTTVADGRRVAVNGVFEGVLKDGREVSLEFADFFELDAALRFARRDTFFFAPMV